MSFNVATYSPSDVILDVSGYRITGFNEIRVTKNSPSFSLIKGIRGKNSRTRNRDTSCTITVDVIQTSIVNDVLSELLESDIRNGSTRLTLGLTDSLGSSKIVSKEAFIESYPELIYSSDITYRRWTIICASTDFFSVSGNSRSEGSSFSAAIDDIGNKFSNIL